MNLPGAARGVGGRASETPPDILLVVLDCVRADLFDAQVGHPGAMPFLAGLRPEVLEFTGAVSPSSWTVPGHASLFTGLYPWDHGAHYRNGPILTAEPETIAERLGRSGYATGFFSGNAYVQPSTGLTRGFQESAWGGGREFYLRFLEISKATCPNLGGPALVWLPTVEGEGRPSRWRDLAMSGFSRLPAVWDGLNRLGGKVRGTYSTAAPEVCSWIGPQLESWVAAQPRERPVFAFVNLFEAHEPYLAGAGLPVGLGPWLSFARCGQDPVLWVRGSWRPTPREVAEARSAYLASLRTIDRRLQDLVNRFRRHRAWANTVFVLTSDHGQAFLEGETLYHRFRVDEPIARIPLWVRAPGAERTAARLDDWVSLVDVPRTLSEVAGTGSFGDASARSLLHRNEDGPRAVYAMTDGIPAGEIPHVDASRRQFLDRLEVAAYLGDRKSIAGEAGTLVSYRTSRPLAEPLPRQVGNDDAPDSAEAARHALELAVARIASRPYHGSVERRIAGWGY